MLSNCIKRSLSLVTAIVMLLALLPNAAYAAEPTKGTAEDTFRVVSTAENPVLPSIQEQIDSILVCYGVLSTMSKEEIGALVCSMDSEYREALYEVSLLEQACAEAVSTGDVSADELNQLLTEKPEITVFAQALQDRYTQDTSTSLLATTVTVLDDKISLTGTSTISESNGIVTAKANGGKFSQTTNTITITNSGGTAAKISFSYSASNYGSFSESSASGTKVVDLAAGASITMSVKGKAEWTNNTATLTLFSFSYTAAAASSKVTFDYSGGNVTLDGETVANGSVVDISSTTGAALVATPASGYTFLGWVNGNTNALISSEASYTLKPTETMTVRAAFASASSIAWFKAGDYLLDDLNKAVTLSTLVIPMYDGTLPADDYVIPSGVTLLIPYNEANTLCEEIPSLHNNTYTAPSVYRTLTMASGANITVNGAISVSGSQSSKYSYNGMPSGPLGFIKMNSGSTITVENGANLYAWGYITGSGSVEVNSGGTVHECFQIADYRGGDATSQIVGKDDAYGVFPFNQYYLQNVEVPLTLHVGAKENGYGSVYVTLAGTKSLSVPFVGASDSMFVINTGYVVKDYMEGTGRTSINVYGDMTITEISMSMKVALVGSLNIDTSKYALPIPNHMTMSVESGTISLNQNIEFLPGSELYVKEGANCVLGEGKQIYVYDMDQWLYNNGANGYAGTGNKPYINIPYVPGGNGTTGRLKDALIQVDGTVDVSLGNAYVTSGGANIYSTGTGVVKVASTIDTVTYQVITADTDIDSWPSIEMQPLILQDGDGTTVSTATVANEGYGEGTYTYYADTQKWCPPGHRYNGGVVTKPTCTDNGYTVYTCLACGDSYTDADSVQSALGHSWSNWTNKSADDVPSATNVGTQTRVCTNCTKSEERAVFKIYGTSVKVGDSLELYFYIHKDVLNSDDISSGAYNAKLTRAYVDDPETDTKNDACEKETNISSNTWQVYDDYYRFCYSGIAAKEMMDEVKVVIYHNGEEASIEATETIAGYAERTLRKYEKKKTEDSSNFTEKNEQLQTILVDMLNYGAACQTFFEYDTENLATKNISVYSGYASGEMQTCTEGDITGSYDASISAKNKLMYSFYIDSVVPVSVTVTYTNHYGTEITPEVSVAKTTKEVDGETKTYYRVDVPGLAIADGRQPITCVVTDTSGNNTTFTGSIQSFVAKKQALLEDADTTNDPKADEMTAYEMLIKFVDSARTYFGTAASNTAA